MSQLGELVASGDVAIISAGFRCFTKIEITKQLGIAQESLAFDSGFFPPAAVARMLSSDAIGFQHGHVPCMKFENFEDRELGKGLRFTTSTYEEIDRLAVSPTMPNLNQMLDSTFGYYTLDIEHQYVLAHYNWHKFAAGKNGRVWDVDENVRTTGLLLTKRLNRLKEKAERARVVLLVVGETQQYKFMMIDDAVHMLNDYAVVAEAAARLFGEKCRVVTLRDIATPQAALDLL